MHLEVWAVSQVLKSARSPAFHPSEISKCLWDFRGFCFFWFSQFNLFVPNQPVKFLLDTQKNNCVKWTHINEYWNFSNTWLSSKCVASFPQAYCNRWDIEKFNLKAAKYTSHTAGKTHPFCTPLSSFYCLVSIRTAGEKRNQQNRGDSHPRSLWFSFSTTFCYFYHLYIFLFFLIFLAFLAE